MNPVHCKHEEQHKDNYYTFIQGVQLYIDTINERVKILDAPCITEQVIHNIVQFSRKKNLSKIISNCRSGHLETFRGCGFVLEGIISGYYQGEDAYCVSYFLDFWRMESPRKEMEDSIINQCMKDSKRFSPGDNHDYIVREATESDIPQMIHLFSSVFETYPTPVLNKEYMKHVMSRNIRFKVAEKEGTIISIASADMDLTNRNAEITDCATDPDHRGKAILPNLINSLEADLRLMGFQTAYSLSRAINPGINKALNRLDYVYCGRLVNNCNICGGFEDMNIWVKRLATRS